MAPWLLNWYGGVQKDSDGDEQASTSKSAPQADVAQCLVAAWQQAGLSSMAAHGPGIAQALLSSLSPGMSFVCTGTAGFMGASKIFSSD